MGYTLRKRSALLIILALVACSGHGNGSSVIPSGALSNEPARANVASAGPQLVQSSNGAQFSASSISVTFKSVPASGDVLVVFFSNNGTTSGAAITYAPPSGWTQIDVDTAHTNHSYSAFYHVASSSESTAYAFTPSCVCRETTWIASEYANVNTAAPIDAHGFNFISNSTSWATPALTPKQTGDLAIVAMMPAQFSLTWSNAGGWTVDLGPTSTWSQELLHEAQTGTTPVSEASTLSGAGYGYAAIVLLAPQSGSPPPTPPPTPTPSPPPGTAPQLAQAANGAQFAASAISVAFKSVPASGHVLVAFFSNNGTTSGAPITYTPPSGWTQLDVDTAHTSHSYSAFYHVTGSGESNSYLFTPSCTCRETTWIAADYVNVNTASPIDAHGFNFISNSTSWTTPSKTPSHSNDLAAVAMMPSQFSLTWSNASGWTRELGPTSVWSQELLQEAQSSTSAVSEVSTLSGAGIGYAAIVLLSPGSGGGGGGKVDWGTWGMKPSRNSYNPVEATLTTSNVGGLHQHWATNVGGIITDAPVVAANVPGTSQGTVDLLFIGDAHANFYAMNAQTGAIVWQKTLQTQVIDGNAQGTLGCFDQPGGVYGIGGSPTIDRSRGLVFVVDALGNLYGFDLATGTQKIGPVAMWQFQNGVNITNDYGALNEDSSAGVIYVPGGAHCGLANYGGVQTYNLATGAITHFYTEGGPPNVSGGVWGAGSPVIDPRSATNPSMNNIYFGTAFGPLGTGKFSYSVVRLTESLAMVAANNPVTTTCCPDLDFGDTPLVFTPTSGCGTTLVAAESKNGVFYVYNADAINSGPIQSIQLGTSTGNGINLGTAAYDPTRNLLFIQNGGDSSNTSTGLRHGLIAFTVTSGCALQLVWQQTVGPNQLPDGPPSPPTIANGVVYYADGPGPGNCSPVAHTCTPGMTADFYAFNETNGAMLFHTTRPAGLFTAPVVVNGTVYLTSWNGEGPGIVYAFGL